MLHGRHQLSSQISLNTPQTAYMPVIPVNWEAEAEGLQGRFCQEYLSLSSFHPSLIKENKTEQKTLPFCISHTHMEGK